jgi:phosphohistidine phosphatase
MTKPPRRPAARASTTRRPVRLGQAREPVELYLLRHADAGDATNWAGDDAERPLSPKGRRQAKRLGSLLAGIKLHPDVILTSPKIRAAETAKIVGRAVSVKPQEDDRLAASVTLLDLAKLLAGNQDARRVVLVGHDPDFSTLASSLTGTAIELKKGGIARIDLGDGGPRPGGGALRWLVPPGVPTD